MLEIKLFSQNRLLSLLVKITTASIDVTKARELSFHGYPLRPAMVHLKRRIRDQGRAWLKT